jgi:8-oxo-dGTP pyrophosphatase MutT (NUDIX family)
MDFKREFSAGCVVFKKEKKKIIFLLGKHSGYHKWVLPKGLIEEGEKGWQTAIRETEEEMGVKARLIRQKPIHTEKYVYVADYKEKKEIKKLRNREIKGGNRRVTKYQEDGGSKIRVFKTVSFYLAEYESGDPKKHGWEMEDGGWFNYKKALELMSFKGEKEALQKAKEEIGNLAKTPFLFSP